MVSVDSSGLNGFAAAAAVCPIGTVDFAAHGSALMSNLASDLRFGGVHAALGGATQAWGASLIADDNV